MWWRYYGGMFSSSLWPDGSEKMYKCPAVEPGCGWLAIKNNKYQVQSGQACA